MTYFCENKNLKLHTKFYNFSLTFLCMYVLFHIKFDVVSKKFKNYNVRLMYHDLGKYRYLWKGKVELHGVYSHKSSHVERSFGLIILIHRFDVELAGSQVKRRKE